jgi:hypothetical protein
MPASAHEITRADIIPDAEFAQQRKARRAELLPVKQRRRVALGPYCTFYFESFDTMLFQVQEMLLIEKGGEAQIPDELAAYNPLVPNGHELVATVMFEVEDPVRRANLLNSLGNVEDHFQLRIGSDAVAGVPDSEQERTREDGKTSSVHFLRFPLSREQIAAFRDPSLQVMVACDDPRYAHLAVLGAEVREELAKDFAD